MSWLPVTFTTCAWVGMVRVAAAGPGNMGGRPRTSLWRLGTAAPRAPGSPRCCHGPAYRLVGDDELDNGEGIEDSNGGDVPGRGRVGVRGTPAACPRLGHGSAPLPSHSPEVDLVLLAQHPLVLAGQVGHTEVLLEGEAGGGAHPSQRGAAAGGQGAWSGTRTLVRMTFLS